MKEKHAKETKKRVYVFSVLELILIGIIFFSGIKIFSWFRENLNSSKTLDEVSEAITINEKKETEQSSEATENTEKYIVNFEMLKEKNKKTVGWLKVEGTEVQYPLVQAKDNSYYLTHSFDNSYNTAGWPFVDYRNKLDGTDKNVIIYGHNRKDGSMFSSLRNILNKDWYEKEENRKITFITQDATNLYEVFSVYRIEDEDYYIQTNFKNNFGDFVNTLKKRSITDFGVEVDENSQILTLSTCDNNNDYRVVLHAKKMER